jgi:signal transduction histidine kinase/serine phosphatase RsbU (regulator of sigma subunit)
MSSHKLQFKESLTRTTLIKMGFRIAVVIIAVTVVSYWHVMSNLESQVVEQLEEYIVERGQRESILFQLVEENNNVLKKEFISRYQEMSKEYSLPKFNQLFEKWEDGTTRMHSKYFDGIKQPGGLIIENMSGLIVRNANITADLRHRLVIGYEIVSRYGPAWNKTASNLYFMTRENANLVIYWPGTPWNVVAPADTDLTPTEAYYMTDFAHNPHRETLWTGLYLDPVAKKWMVSCVTPIDIKGQHIASVGVDVMLDDLFERTINDHLEGAYNLIFREDARLVAHPEKMADIQKEEGFFNILQSGDQSLIRIFQLVKKMGSKQVVIDNTEGDEYLAVTRIQGPDWYFVTVYPKSLLAHLAFDTASFILFLGLISLLIEITVLFVVLRKQVAKPLHDFLDATEQITKGNFNIKLDVTRQDELGRLANSFNAMAHEVDTREEGLKQVQASLRQANILKDEFLANTSHELRTPLNGIIGIAESLIDGATGQLTEKTKTNLVMIVGSGKRLSALVNDILDFSQLKHKNLELQLKPIGLREIVDIVLALSQSSVGNKPLQLLNTIPVDLPPAQADENRLQQILYNLIGNAIKFTDSGTIEISATVVNQHLEMVVSDTGIGIPEDKLERIFKSFEQAEGSTARKYGGTGLGLAVTKQLVQLHGGKIRVKSTVNQGSQFFLTLPIAEGKSSQLSVNTLSLVQKISPVEVSTLSTSDKVKATSGDKLNILIVDDEPVNLQVLYNYLSLQNYHITQATSGPEALALIDEGLKPDAILLDVMMPKMTGYTVTKKIRERWKADKVPILLLTAKNQVADLVVGFESGANDYLTKPIYKDELLARLKTHLQLKKLKEKTLHLALENERMKTEIEITHRIQQMILPKEEELDQLPNLEIAGFMEPADEVGGDYYDVIQHNGRVLIGIGDVTGHGLESGMLMLMAQAGIRTLLENEEQDAVKFLNSLNGMIFKNAQERLEVDKNLTLSLLEYQPTAQTGGVLRISGHHEDIIVVRNGNLERIDTGDLGFQVGFVEDIAEFVAQIEVTLNLGDLVVLYTDGITEAENKERKEYGIERLCSVVKQNWQQSVKGIRQAVIDDVRQYIDQQKVFDDITLVVFKQK